MTIRLSFVLLFDLNSFMQRWNISGCVDSSESRWCSGRLSLCVAGLFVLQGRWQSQMQQLRDMGIQDEELMLRALQATDGDIQAALELIFAGGPGL